MPELSRNTLLQQGDEGDAFYVIHTGKVGVYSKIKNEISNEYSMKFMAELKQGDSFGELSLLYGEKRSATIVSLVPTDLIVLDKANYERIVKARI